MARKEVTTITLAKYHEAVEGLKKRGGKCSKRIACDIIPGFFLEVSHSAKGSVSATWRLKYTSKVTGIQENYPLGKFTKALMPEQAGKMASGLVIAIDSGACPKSDKQGRINEAKEEHAELVELSSLTLGRLIKDHYKPWLIEEITEESAIHRIRTYLAPPSGFKAWMDTPLSAINEDWVHRWQSKQKKYALNTIKRNFDELNVVMSSMTHLGVIPVNPIEGVKLRQLTNAERKAEADRRERKEALDKKKRRPLEDWEKTGIAIGYKRYKEEVLGPSNHWDGHSMHWLEVFISLGYNHGMRPGDIRRMEWFIHINLDVAQISFTPRKTRHHPDPARVEHDIHPSELEVLKRWYEQLGSPKAGSFVFPSAICAGKTSKSGHIERGTHNAPFKKIVTLGGLDPDAIDFYAFRHNFISQMIMDNKSMKTVATLAGHKTTRMIEHNYGHIDKLRANEALEVISSKPLGLSDFSSMGTLPTTDGIDSQPIQ